MAVFHVCGQVVLSLLPFGSNRAVFHALIAYLGVFICTDYCGAWQPHVSFEKKQPNVNYVSPSFL